MPTKITKSEQTKGATNVIALGHFLSILSAILTIQSRPPAPCRIEVQAITATIMRMVDTGGELGLRPKSRTRMQSL